MCKHPPRTYQRNPNCVILLLHRQDNHTITLNSQDDGRLHCVVLHLYGQDNGEVVLVTLILDVSLVLVIPFPDDSLVLVSLTPYYHLIQKHLVLVALSRTTALCPGQTPYS